jgi:hypothetical protein
VPCPVAPSRPCCGKTRQSKRLSSILVVQSRISGNLLSSLFIYENANTRALWAPHGLNAWLLGLSKDHYQCNLYYVPESKGYCVFGSANLFPQHCIASAFTPVTHAHELSTELQEILARMGRTKHTSAILKTLVQHLYA